MYVSPECGLRYWRADLHKVDPILLRCARRFVKPGCCVWDVGANLGLFSFAALGLGAATVVAVEPDEWLVSLLRRSAALQKRGNISIVPTAVAEQAGERRFNVARRSRSANFLDDCGSTQTGGIRESHVVRCVTLDGLLRDFPAPDVLKIDVEGAELLVLRGAGAVLSQRPSLICEIGGEHAVEAAEILKKYGYEFEDAETGVKTDLPAYSTIAIPDRAERYNPIGNHP